MFLFINYFGLNLISIDVNDRMISVCCYFAVIKFVLLLVIRKIASPSAAALAQDHRNDALSNIVALVMGFVGERLLTLTGSQRGNKKNRSLSIEWNSIRLGGPSHGIVTKLYTKLCQGHFLCLSKTGPCAVISSQISTKFT